MTLLDAVQEGAADILNSLLQAEGCRVNDLIDGRSLLSWACQLGHADVVAVLLNHGADPNLHDCCESVCTGTPLHEAVEATCSGIVEMLLSHGANSNVQDKEGRPPLALLAIQEVYIGRTAETQQIASNLIKHGAKIDSPPTACAYGDERLLQQLLDAGADAESMIEPVWLTGLHVAAATGNLPCLRLLISRTPDPNPFEWEHRTPLDVARDPGVSEFLLQHNGKHGEELDVFPEPRPLLLDLLLRKKKTEPVTPADAEKTRRG